MPFQFFEGREARYRDGASDVHHIVVRAGAKEDVHRRIAWQGGADHTLVQEFKLIAQDAPGRIIAVLGLLGVQVGTIGHPAHREWRDDHRGPGGGRIARRHRPLTGVELAIDDVHRCRLR